MSTGQIILIVWISYALLFTLAIWRKAPQGRKAPRASLGKDRPLRLLIIGSTGGAGRQLVEEALKLGHEVTALARGDCTTIDISAAQWA